MNNGEITNSSEAEENGTNSGNITVGNVTGTGIAIGHGAMSIVQQYSSSGTDLADAFKVIYEQIDSRQSDTKVDKDEIGSTVKRIENEVASPEPNPSKVERWLSFLADMAPDIFDVTVATLTSPIAGISMTIKKIAEKARAQKQ